jgi:hypothetical protein
MALVYQHRRLDTNEVFYVGVGVGKKRAYERTRRNKHWYNIINKTEYVVEILQEELSWDEARQEEIRLIAEYGRRDLGKGPLVNMTDGGDGTVGVIKTEDQKRQLSEKTKGRGLGRKLPAETRAKLSQAAKLRKASDATRQKISSGIKNSNNSNAKTIQHIPTGTIYKGKTYAAKALGVHPSTIDYKLKIGEFKFL